MDAFTIKKDFSTAFDPKDEFVYQELPPLK